MTKLHHLLFGIFIVAIANNQIDLPQRVIKMLKYWKLLKKPLKIQENINKVGSQL